MTFADHIRQRVQAGLSDADAGDGPFVQVLHELAEGLRSDLVGAAILHGPRTGRHSLALWPRGQPSRRELVLSFWVMTTGIRVATTPPIDFHDPAALEAWLADHVTQPALLESLVVLGEAAKMPALAYLRTLATEQPSVDDVAVFVGPSDQHSLVDLPAGTPVDLTVFVLARPNAPTYDPSRSYGALDSCGLSIGKLRVTANTESTLRIQGEKLAEPELDPDPNSFVAMIRAQNKRLNAQLN
jgi:hypothetical protein